MLTHPRLSQLFIVGAFALLAACAPEAQRAEAEHPGAPATITEATTPGEPGVRTERTTTTDVPHWRVTAVHVDVGLAELCGIDKSKAHFEYDSARLDDETRAMISALTDCFVDGPLAGRDVVVVGHADPRGPDEYNRELGMNRAEAVAQQFIRGGMPSTRIDVESHGEAHASSDPAEWPDERRVDVMIAN